MSDSIDFRLVAIQPEHLADYLEYQNENTGKRDPFTLKSMHGASRNGWFMAANRVLIAEAGQSELLGFLSNERSTVTRVTGDQTVGFAVTGSFKVVRTPEDRQRWESNPRWGYVWETTIVSDVEIPPLAAALERHWTFCIENIARHNLLRNVCNYDSAQDLLSSLQFAEDINDSVSDDDGETSDFYFLALYSIRSLVAEALEKKWALVYVNDAYVSIVEAA